MIATLLTMQVAAGAPDFGAPMTEAQRDYFAGEKRGAIGFGAAGLVAGAAGGLALLDGGELGEGLAWPLFTVGAIELGAGLVLYLRTDGQVADLDALRARDAEAYQRAEARRMRRVDLQFTVLEWVEGALALGGAGLAVWAAGEDDDFWLGVGLGLTAQSIAMFTMDYLAHRRARPYARALDRYGKDLSLSLAPLPGGAALGVLGRF